MEVIALAVYGVLFGIILLRMNISVLLFLSYNFAAATIGLGVLASDGVAQWSTVWIYGGCFAALLLGWVARRSRRPSEEQPVVAAAPGFAFSKGGVFVVVLIAGGLALYHLFAGGIPLFSDGSIEVDRFDFTSSGLFGVPGRMFLFGVPIAWMLATVAASQESARVWTYAPWVWATGFYVLVSVLSGFKSGLWAMLVIMTFSFIVITGTRISLFKLLLKRGWLLFVALGFGLYTLSTYPTYQMSEVPIWRAILNRVTVVGAQPKQFAIEGRAAGAIDNGFLNDLLYFIPRYLGNQVPGSYSLERAVSAEIIGVDPASSAWTTPVTVAGFPEIVYSFGPALALIIAFGVGVALKALHQRRSSSQMVVIAQAITLYLLYNWLVKGGLIYYSLNIGFVAVVLIGLAWIVTLLRKPSSTPSLVKRPAADALSPALPRR